MSENVGSEVREAIRLALMFVCLLVVIAIFIVIVRDALKPLPYRDPSPPSTTL